MKSHTPGRPQTRPRACSTKSPCSGGRAPLSPPPSHTLPLRFPPGHVCLSKLQSKAHGQGLSVHCVLHSHPPHPMPAPPNSVPTPAANELPRLPWVLAQAQVWGPSCGCRPLHLCKVSLFMVPSRAALLSSLLALSSAPCTPGPRQKALFVPVLFLRTPFSPFLSSQSLLPWLTSQPRAWCFFPSWPVSMGPGQSEDSEKSRGFVCWTETDKRACVCSIKPRAKAGSGGYFGGHQPPIRQFPRTTLGSAGQLPDFPETTAPPPTRGGDLSFRVCGPGHARHPGDPGEEGLAPGGTQKWEHIHICTCKASQCGGINTQPKERLEG